MNKTIAHDYGFDNGYGIADTNINEIDVGSLEKEDLDKFIDDMISFEQDEFRQYSPFEFFAKDVNELPEFDAEECWEAYDEGVEDGIEQRIKEFKNEGIR
jgi:hypothetical protein